MITKHLLRKRTTNRETKILKLEKIEKQKEHKKKNI